MSKLHAIEGDRDPQILAAINAGARIKDITRATGLTRSRVYQIKDKA